MSARAVPFHCPYCGDTDLRPHEDSHGAWECHSCLRAFTVKMLGQLRPPSVPEPSSAPELVEGPERSSAPEPVEGVAR